MVGTSVSRIGFLLDRRLADQAFAGAEARLQLLAFGVGVAGEQPQIRLLGRRFVEVDDAVLHRHERRELRQNRARHGGEVALALQQARELREVRLQPVLRGVLLRRIAQVDDHFVDVVLERRDFAGRFNVDRLRQVALGHGGRDFGDGAHLRGQVGGEAIDVVGEVLPRAGDAAHVGLAAELAFGADFLRDARHFGGERAELVHHRVDGVLQLENFAADVDGDLLRQVAAGDGGRDVGDVAHLVGQVAGHRVDRSR